MTDASARIAEPVYLRGVYLDELRSHAVTLIWRAHARLDRSTLATANEDAITGELVREMKRFAEGDDAPDWAVRYDISEQVAQNIPGRLGNARPRIDFEIERHIRGPRFRLGFEAKRLGRGSGRRIGNYLGTDGLGAFLAGYYPTTHGEAGMVGYFQEGDHHHWIAKLRQMLANRRARDRVVEGSDLEVADCGPGLLFSRSQHTTVTGQPLLVIHVLLPCIF